jgi:hypothetical protein
MTLVARWITVILFYKSMHVWWIEDDCPQCVDVAQGVVILSMTMAREREKERGHGRRFRKRREKVGGLELRHGPYLVNTSAVTCYCCLRCTELFKISRPQNGRHKAIERNFLLYLEANLLYSWRWFLEKWTDLSSSLFFLAKCSQKTK